MDVETIDELGTTEEDARKLLENFIRNGFLGIDEAAMALGRPASELEDILNGDEFPDEDLVMKIRGIADERDIEI